MTTAEQKRIIEHLQNEMLTSSSDAFVAAERAFIFFNAANLERARVGLPELTPADVTSGRLRATFALATYDNDSAREVWS